jgi:hypothetical protein
MSGSSTVSGFFGMEIDEEDEEEEEEEEDEEEGDGEDEDDNWMILSTIGLLERWHSAIRNESVQQELSRFVGTTFRHGPDSEDGKYFVSIGRS